MKITAEQLNNICPSLKNKAPYIADTLNDILPKYGMDSKDIVEEFLPNVLVECAEFTTFEENLNYRADALIKMFGRHRISISQANQFGKTPEHPANKIAIANCIYGGEWGKINLGNTLPNDGWDFRGAGILQITGRGLTTQFTAYYNRTFNQSLSATQVAAMMRNKEDLTISTHAAAWFFSIAKKLIPMALADNFKDIVKRINGGYNGINERTAFYERCKIYLPPSL